MPSHLSLMRDIFYNRFSRIHHCSHITCNVFLFRLNKELNSSLVPMSRVTDHITISHLTWVTDHIIILHIWTGEIWANESVTLVQSILNWNFKYASPKFDCLLEWAQNIPQQLPILHLWSMCAFMILCHFREVKHLDSELYNEKTNTIISESTGSRTPGESA